MTDLEFETVKPVLVFYDRDVKPTDLHPVGMQSGMSFEVSTPELAYQFHPDARILRYVDGEPFRSRQARAEIKLSHEGDPLTDEQKQAAELAAAELAAKEAAEKLAAEAKASKP